MSEIRTRSIKAQDKVLGKTLTGAVQYGALETLIDELLKENPCEAEIQKLMSGAGLEYISDSVQRLSHVLEVLSREQDRKNKRRKGPEDVKGS